MTDSALSRDDLVSMYLDQLPYEPYPVQEEALLAWFATAQGLLVCAPTGTGKTLIAEAALFEALHTGRVAYYTTPLIALCDQKFREIQDSAERWGFSREDVGLVTGNRKVNPDAKVLVVVAEILLNRLLNPEAFEFENVLAVVMDEFHSFNDPERGIVWELSLGMLPKHVRLLLLSATVGNTADFMIWLNRAYGRRLDLIQSTERKVPLRYHWVENELLNEQIEIMASGDDQTRRTPMLLFCFNREECWTVAEQLRGRSLLSDGQQQELARELQLHDWSQGIGPKLKTILLRGVGVHHAGVLPKYKKIIEDLFQRKLLTVCVCTETLSAGMNLPARSVLMTTLLKGPPGKKTLIDASIAHQIFGRAGRPQFDSEGHVYALAHEDDVKILRFKEKLDQIPEDTRDPLLIKKRKQLKKKAPKRRTTEQYWTEPQFQKLIDAPPTSLRSQGVIPWRLLAYLLCLSPDVARVRQAISRRLMDSKAMTVAQNGLVEMLLTLHRGGFINLYPAPPPELLNQRPGWQSSDVGEAIEEREPLTQRLNALAEQGIFGAWVSWNDFRNSSPRREATGSLSDLYDDAGSEVITQPRGMAGVGDDDDPFGTGLEDDDSTSSSDGESGPVDDNDTGSSEDDADSAVSEDSSDSAVAGTHSDASQRESSSVVEVSNNAEPSTEGETGEAPIIADMNGGAEDPAGAGIDKQKPVRLTSSLKALLAAQGVDLGAAAGGKSKPGGPRLIHPDVPQEIIYEPDRGYPNESLPALLTFKSINPLYGSFLVDVLPHADAAERMQALESVLVFPGALVRNLRIPRADQLPPSVFTQEFLHPELLQRGLATIPELALQPQSADEVENPEDRVWPLTFPEKLLRLFRAEYPGVRDVTITAVWAAGEVLNYGGDFNKLVTTRRIARQEGIVFRHVLRMVLLCEEFMEHVPSRSDWWQELQSVAEQLTEACRRVDPQSTDMMIESAHAPDPLFGELPKDRTQASQQE